VSGLFPPADGCLDCTPTKSRLPDLRSNRLNIDTGACFGEALEFVLDGFALDRCGHERSQERLSQAQSLQATSGIAARACRSLRKGHKQSRSCPNCEGRLTSFTATPASQSSTKHGAIPTVRAALVKFFKQEQLKAQQSQKTYQGNPDQDAEEISQKFRDKDCPEFLLNICALFISIPIFLSHLVRFLLWIGAGFRRQPGCDG
jgi:hypothetical protein